MSIKNFILVFYLRVSPKAVIGIENVFRNPLAEPRQRALRRRGLLDPSCLRRGRLRRPLPRRCRPAAAAERTSRPVSTRTTTSWSPPLPPPPLPWRRPPSETGKIIVVFNHWIILTGSPTNRLTLKSFTTHGTQGTNIPSSKQHIFKN